MKFNFNEKYISVTSPTLTIAQYVQVSSWRESQYCHTRWWMMSGCTGWLQRIPVSAVTYLLYTSTLVWGSRDYIFSIILAVFWSRLRKLQICLTENMNESVLVIGWLLILIEFLWFGYFWETTIWRLENLFVKHEKLERTHCWDVPVLND